MLKNRRKHFLFCLTRLHAKTKELWIVFQLCVQMCMQAVLRAFVCRSARPHHQTCSVSQWAAAESCKDVLLIVLPAKHSLTLSHMYAFIFKYTHAPSDLRACSLSHSFIYWFTHTVYSSKQQEKQSSSQYIVCHDRRWG